MRLLGRRPKPAPIEHLPIEDREISYQADRYVQGAITLPEYESWLEDHINPKPRKPIRYGLADQWPKLEEPAEVVY